MDNERAVAIPERMMTLTDMMTLGDMFAKSGFFADSKQVAQAVVKIQAGRELGFPPVVSMTGINIVLGKVSIGAGLMAALVKRSKRYDYAVKRLDETACVLEFSDNGKMVYASAYTTEDAKKAGLLGKDMWQKYPKNMLFARSLSNGARIVCPELVTGVYTPEELGLAIDGDGNAIIDSTATPVTSTSVDAPPPPAATTGVGTMAFAQYIADKTTLGRFWQWTKTLKLTEPDVYAALNVEHLADATGTVQAVKDTIASYAKTLAAKDTADLFGEPAQDVQP